MPTLPRSPDTWILSATNASVGHSNGAPLFSPLAAVTSFTTGGGAAGLLASRWSLPNDGVSVYLAEDVADLEANEEQTEQVAPAPVDELPPGLLPAGWSVESVMSVLVRLPRGREVCLWPGPPFPIDGDDIQALPEDEREWHSRAWSGERWRQGWMDVFPSQMRSRTPEDEIPRQWIHATRLRLMADQEYHAFAEAVRLEAAESMDAPWEAIARALFLDPLTGVCARLRPWPVCVALAIRKLSPLFGDSYFALAWGEELRDRTAKVEQEYVPLARASLRAMLAQNHPGADAEAAARLLLLIGEPEDADVLRGVTTLDLRGWPVTACSVGCLAGMSWLQCLSLSGARLDLGPGKRLQPLSALTRLKKLALAGLDLKSDMWFLRDLAGLEDLDLSGNDLNDGSISSAGLMHHGSLRKLDLRFNWSISVACKQTLQARLPGCEILF